MLKDFMRQWEQRAQDYTQQRAPLEQRTQQSAETAVRSIQASAPSAPEALNEALGDTRQLSYLYGRYQTLWALREHMEKKPSMAVSEMWLQSQVEGIRAKIAASDAAEQDLRRSVPGRDLPLIQWVGAVERLAQDRGYSEGATAELTLINENLRSYYAARAEEHERAVRLRTTLLAGLAMVLSQQQNQMRELGVGSVGGPGRERAFGTPPGASTLCPDGTYVSGACHMTPKGTYVGD
ncbi:hypothetical protein [Rhizorhabdus dicambivorans]|uniref:Uncharacterized protein n=1 Tax=Rhizorhabdus dicambivorans TaxID=1850238 RepID=A0A2A4FTB7_9SPHN|nr:hypothetical protein [Rhizorhabdus dicambivorans]PCE40946.1 hypothetical protein COO09_18120 [Rhizorhabdus dicambivorans]